MRAPLVGHGVRCVRHEGFTILELLVVITSTLVLGSLLLVATSKSRETARAVQCASNLRQIGSAAQLYSADNDGRILPSRVSFGPDGYWPYLLAPYLGMAKQGTTPVGSVRNTVYMCPVDKANASGSKEYILGVYPIRYSINSHIAEVSDMVSNAQVARVGRMSQMKPTKTMLFMDAFQGGLGWASTIASTYPHQRKANALYLDGHVEAKTPEEIEYYRRYPFHVFWRGYDWGYGGYRED